MPAATTHFHRSDAVRGVASTICDPFTYASHRTVYPERAPDYHVKDKLENKLHDMVCSGAISLRNAQRQIPANWRGLYLRVFGSAPTV